MMLVYDYSNQIFIILNEDKEAVDEYIFYSKNLTLPFSGEIVYLKEEAYDDGEYTGEFLEETGTIIPLNAINSIRMVADEYHNTTFNAWLEGYEIKDRPKYLKIGERHELMEFSPRR